MEQKRIKVRLTKNSPYSNYGYYERGDIGYIDGYVNDNAVIILENGKFAKADLRWIEVVNEEDKDVNSELAESENEKVRKVLVELISTYLRGKENGKIHGVYAKDILAWLEKQGAKVSAIEGFETEFERQVSYLIASAINKEYEYNQGYVKWAANALLNYAKHEIEKQGEQKSVDEIAKEVCKNKASAVAFLKSTGIMNEKGELAEQYRQCEDKIEPKFHEGEWLCENEPNNYARFIQILEIVNVQGKDRYRISRDIHNDEDIVEFDFVEKYYHKFDIQDANDGDVLYHKAENGIEYIVMSKGLNEFNNIDSYFRYNSIDGFGIDVPSVLSAKCDSITPATKEQREQLEKAMTDAGYTFDFEKRELKKLKG